MGYLSSTWLFLRHEIRASIINVEEMNHYINLVHRFTIEIVQVSSIWFQIGDITLALLTIMDFYTQNNLIDILLRNKAGYRSKCM